MSKELVQEYTEHVQLLNYAKDVSRLYQDLKQENELLKKANQRLNESYFQTIQLGFDLISLNSEFLGGHCKRVSVYVKDLAEKINIPEDAQINATFAALIHDIGLIGMPKKALMRILSGKERSEEMLDIYRQHTQVAVGLPALNERFQRVVDIIHAHHEQVDGKGYPKGLQGNEIPIESRMVSIASGFDEIKQLADHPLKPEIIFSKMEREVGTKYDENIFETFKNSILVNDTFTNIVKVDLHALVPGMVLAKPIMVVVTSRKVGEGQQSIKNVRVLAADTKIREDQINSLKTFFRHRDQQPMISIYNGSDTD